MRSAFLSGRRTVYVEAATATGFLTNPGLTRVIGHDDPDGSSYALQLCCPSLREALPSHADTAVLLRDDMKVRFGEKVLFFTTYLEVIDL